MKSLAETFSFDDLVAGYADTAVLRGISVGLSRGEVLGVIGRNGVGKSTLLRTLAGVMTPFSGSVAIGGRALIPLAAYARRRLGISYAPQERVVFDELSVADNLTLGQNSRDLSGFAESFARFPRIQERLTQKAGLMSGGEKKLLSFVRVLGEQAAISLLDEPTEGVAPENVALMAQAVLQRKQSGAAFIVVEQNIEFLLSVADRLLVLDHGESVAYGAIAEFSRERIEQFLAV